MIEVQTSLRDGPLRRWVRGMQGGAESLLDIRLVGKLLPAVKPNCIELFRHYLGGTKVLAGQLDRERAVAQSREQSHAHEAQ